MTQWLPLTSAQQRLWFLCELSPEAAAAWTLPYCFRVRGPVDLVALEAAWRAIEARHEALRARFAAIDGQPRQRVAPDPELQLEQIDVSMLDPDEREPAAMTRVREIVARPFDLVAGPVLRVAVIRLDAATHFLLLTIHHIVSDASSVAVILAELSATYAALVAGREPALPGRALGLAGQLQWNAGRVPPERLARQLAHWTERLAGVPPLELPTDRRRAAAFSHHGARHRFVVPDPLAADVATAAAAQRTTPFVLLLAAFQTFAARHAGQDDFCVGVPISGRTGIEVETAVGLFVNTLPIRTPAGSGRTFRDQVGAVRLDVLTALDNQELRLEELIAALNPARDASRPPLFQVMFQLVALSRRLELAGLEVEVVPAYSGATAYELSLSFDQQGPGGRLSGYLEYATHLFSASTIERMVAHYLQLLRGAIAEPDRPLHAIPMMDPDERQRVLALGAGAPASDDDGRSLSDLFEHQVLTGADRTALLWQGRPVAYGELDRRAEQIAARLHQIGVREEDRVGLRLGRSPDLTAAILAVVKLGAAYVPLDPEYPPRRVTFMARDAGLTAIVCNEGWQPDPGLGAAVIRIEDDLPPTTVDRRRPRIDPDSAAYIIYTSGSTGTPKGVVGTHRGILNRLRWMWRQSPFEAGEVSVHRSSPNFVDSVWELLGPLLSGVPSVVVDDDTARDPAQLIDTLAVHQVTRIVLVPALLASMLELCPDLGRRLPRLRRWTTSGEPIPRELVEQFAAAVPAGELLNLYGSTEVAADATGCVLSGGEPDAPVGIGRPVPGVHAHVLDAGGELAPIGVYGELFVGGVQLARGYWRQPARTAERFVPDPWRPGERLYRTGDLARARADGTLEYRGRADNQVKLRGHRIELGEIESALRQDPRVRDAIAIVREDRPGDRILVAYVVAPDAAPASLAADLRQSLHDRLPAVMVPSAIQLLPELPRTPNRKIDRRALPPPEARGAQPSLAPRSPREAEIAAIWAAALGRDHIGIDDDFFALGGHSLLATTLAHRIRRALDVPVAVKTLFDNPTVRSLTAAIGRTPRRTRRDSATAPVADRTGGRASPIQDRWYRIRRDHPDASTTSPFRTTTDHTLTGRIDPAALAASMAAIVHRHHSLRTGFCLRDGRVMQAVIDRPWQLPVHDLRSSGDLQDRLARIVRDVYTSPLDIEAGDVFRAALITLDDDRHRLVTSFDHLVQDGTSLGIVADETFRLYAELCRDPGRRADDVLGPADPQYLEWSEHQWRLLEGDYNARLAGFWSATLAGAPDLELPVDAAPAGAIGPRIGTQVALRHDLITEIDALALRERVTEPIALMAVLFALLHRTTGQSDLCIAMPADARPPEFQRTVGHFVLPLLIRVRIGPGMSFRALCLAVRHAVLQANEWSQAPVYAVHAPPPGLWRVAFNYQRRSRGFELDGLAIEPTRDRYPEREHLDLDLLLAFIETAPHDISFMMLGRADAFRRETLIRLLEQFVDTARQVVTDPDRAVGSA